MNKVRWFVINAIVFDLPYSFPLWNSKPPIEKFVKNFAKKILEGPQNQMCISENHLCNIYPQ